MTMNCKHCNAELAEETSVCPVCGKEQTEVEEIAPEVTEEVVEETAASEETKQTAAKEETSEEPVLPFETAYEQTAEEQIKEGAKATPGKITAAVIAIVLVAAILIAIIAGGIGGNDTTPTIAPTAGTVAAEPVEIPSNGDPTSALCKETYTVSDDAAAAARDTVVATMGDKVLTNGELQAYYWMEVSLFLQEYGSYAEYIGLDLYTPFDKQVTEMGEKPMSWQQFFLDSAIYTWKTYQSMELESEAVDFEMPEERRRELEELPEGLINSAAEAGLESVDELVAMNIGHGATLDDYVNYVQTYYQGMSYYYDCYDALNPSDAEVEAFFDENEAEYAASNITKDAKYVDVRHVLLQPEGGERGEDGYPVFTDEAWEACRQKAEEIYNNWQAGDKSEESFAQLAVDNSEDGNATTGGLYENVYKGQMVAEFENWCFDEARQTGDHGLVKTRYGYHIMFFCDSRPIKYVDVRHVLLQPEGGETSEDGYPVFTDEAWETCRQKAEKIYTQWQAGDKSEESFAQLAMDYSEDSNASTGGLYEAVTVGQMVKDFENWCFDEVRQIGDHGLVKTQFGYHIMFFCGVEDAWFAQAKADMVDDLAMDMIPAMMEKHPATVDYSQMVLGEVNFN